MDVGDVLAGRYELLERIGAGGMGRVFRARDQRLDREVAVKVLAAHLTQDDQALVQFRQEARVAAAVRHPNVVQVLDAIVDGAAPAIVMEHVPGPSLGDLVPDGGMEVDRALGITAAVGAGLSAVHAAGLVHRDVSPGNVLLDGDVPRLTDFGIARDADATATTTVRGSVGYLAPEQASGVRVGPEADVYALACLTTLLLTGAPPFDAESPVAVVRQHLDASPPDLRSRRPDVPEAVATAVAAALAKDPAERTPTPAAFLTDLGVPPADGPPPAAGLATTTVVERQETAVLDPAALGIGGAAAADDADPTQVIEPPATTTVIPPAAGASTAAAAAGDRRQRGVLIGVVVLLGMLALLFALTRAGDAPQPVGIDEEPTAEPSPSPSPSPEEELPPAEAAAAGLQELREQLIDLRSAGDIGAKALDELDERASKAAEKVAEGKPGDAEKELRELRKKLGETAEDGEVSPEAESAILERVLEIEAAIAAMPEEDDDRGKGKGRDD